MGSETEADVPERGPKRRYTYPEAAEVLRVKERWLRDNIRRLPHSRKGVTVTFSEADLDAIDTMFHHPVPPVTPAHAYGTNPLAAIKPSGPRRRKP
ncbi:hypothetical protein GCM10022384_70210 [Streptomyces marokkonensis]|uniref:Helix-turn-helix domain-containing protein n=1 Tax=Streptomyces marokkonensis TaxID=324855 RepID=A0ABP7SX60_9ACTN